MWILRVRYEKLTMHMGCCPFTRAIARLAKASMDSRGVWRGACLIEECHCSGYERDPGSYCNQCKHPPGMHVKCRQDQVHSALSRNNQYNIPSIPKSCHDPLRAKGGKGMS